MASYNYISPELRVFHGTDSLNALRRELERGKCQRAVVICGRTVGQSEVLHAMRDQLGPLVAGVCATARENSPVSGVDEAARFLKDAGADAVIAVGGGSAAVTARAATIALAEQKPISELSTRRTEGGKFESPRLNAPKLPQFVIPTTPSTAFVKAGTAVHDDEGNRLALFDPKTRARAIFVHPDFVTTAPASLVMSASLNAFTNAVEALEAPNCDPFSEAMLMQALRLIVSNLPDFNGRGLAARERLVVAALLCGRGTEQGGTGLTSVLAHAIGHRCHTANGLVGAIVLPHTMDYNAPVIGDRGLLVMEALDRRLSISAPTSSASVSTFFDSLSITRTLSDLGLAKADLVDIAETAMTDWFISRNARPVAGVGTLIDILEKAW